MSTDLNVAENSAAALEFYLSVTKRFVTKGESDTYVAKQIAAALGLTHITSADPSAEQVRLAQNTASEYLAADSDSLSPAMPSGVGGEMRLAQDKNSYQDLLDLAKKVSRKLNTIPRPPDPGVGPPLNPNASSSASLNDDLAGLPKTGIAYPGILEVTRNTNPITSTLVVWERDFEYFIPLSTLSQQLKFPSTFDPAARRIQGEFIGPENPYAVDVRAGTYTVKGKTQPLPAGAIFTKTERDSNEDAPDDIYISVDLLNILWPLDFAVDLNSQSLTINTARKLPVELELQRKLQQEKLEREKAARESEKNMEKSYVYTPNGYRMLGPQTFTIGNSLRSSESTGTTNHSMVVSGQGDLLGTSASYSLNMENSKDNPIGLEDFTIRLKREDYKSGRLLPFGLDIIDAGDISVRTPSLVTGSLQGTGLFVSNDRDRKNIDFDEVTVEGNAKPGWDVEVYSRGVLIDYGKVDSLGRYRFDNVPLTYGNTPIRLVFYGPNGESEERTENYSIARSMLKPGETTYQAGVVKRGNRVLDLADVNDRDQSPASTIRVNRGINRYLSGFASFTNLDLKGSNESYATVGANFNALGGYGQVEAYKQVKGGEALDVRFARGFRGFDTSIRSAVFNNFESQRTGTGDRRRTTQTSINVAKGLLLKPALLHIGASLDYITYANSESDTNFGTSQSLGSKFGNFSNTTTTNLLGSELDHSDGQISYSKPLSDTLGFNSKLSYEIHPKSELESYDLDLNYSDNDRFTANIGYGQSLRDTDSHTISLGAGYEFDAFIGTANVNIDSEQGVDFTLGTNTTLGPQGIDDIYKFRRILAGQHTRLSVRLYEDLNNNGKYDSADTPVVGVRVLLNGSKKSPPSNEEGFIEIEEGGAEGVTTVTLDRKSMGNQPFLISAKKDGHMTILRAGTKPHIDFPLILSGTIDGTVRNQDGVGISDLTVQLVDAYGSLVGESKTIVDGFYTFELVRPGRYVLQVHPSHRVFVPPKTVVVASDDLFLNGADLQVLSNQNLEQASEAAVATDVEETGRVAHTYQPQAAVGTEKPVTATPSGGGVQPVAGKVSTSEDGVQPVIRAVRIGEYSGKVRLVLDLSGPAVYSINKEATGTVVLVDLPDTASTAQYSFVQDKQNMLANIEVTQRPGGGTQIKVTGKGALDVVHDLLLPATADKSDRIFIDFERAP